MSFYQRYKRGLGDVSMPPGGEGADECPIWDPFCVFPTTTGGGGEVPAVPPLPTLPTVPGTTPTELCPPGWVCQTSEAYDREKQSAKTRTYAYAGGAALVGVLAGVLLGGWAQK